MANSHSGDSMLSRFVRILSAFDPEHPMLGVEALAARAEIPTSTTYRITSEMVEHDLLHKDQDGRLRIGIGMWELANRASDVMTLGRIARPHMLAINAVIGEHTQLCIMRESEVLYLERVSAITAGPNIAQIGGRLPAHASAAGLVLLSHQPARIREAYLRRPLEQVTADTITDPLTLNTMLTDIRNAGFAKLVGTMVADSASYAVPIRGHRGTTLAAVATVVDRENHLPDRRIRSLLTTAAQAIAHAFRTDAGAALLEGE